MARCSYCGLRKGKRNCPALSDVICSQCCGEHRLEEIACPASCSWLGGLQAVVDSTRLTGQIPQHDWDAAVEALFETFSESLGAPYLERALQHFGIDDEPEDWEAMLVLSYAALALRDEAGLRLVDRFMEGRARAMSPAQGAAILVLRNSWASLFEVEEVNPGEGMDLLDLVSGATHRISESTMSRDAEVGEVLFAWVGERGQSLELTAGVCAIPAEIRTPIVDGFREALEHERELRPELEDGALAAELTWQVVSMIREVLDEVPHPLTDLAELDEDELDPERLELLSATLRNHYAGWPDVELPALDGRTPRAACTTEQGRTIVRRLLSEIEDTTRGIPGGETVDFPAMWDDLGLEYDPLILCEYTPDEAPDAGKWLELDEAERLDVVEEFHRISSGPHPEPESPKLHAVIHVAVENQLAEGEPPEVAAAVARLMEAGASRHEAVHAVGSVIAKAIYKVMSDKQPPDEDVMRHELETLRAEDWMGTAPV